MTGSRIASLRDRLDTTDLVALVVLLAVVYATTDGTLESVSSMLVLLVLVPVFRWVLEFLEIGDTTAGLLLGSLVAALGAGAVVVDGSLWIGAGLFAVGCWLVLDTIYESKHGDQTARTDPEDDITEAEMYTLMGHSQWVLEALQEASRPLSAKELRERTGLTEDELEATLEITQGNGTVDRVGNGYVVDESELGGVAFVRGIVRSIGARIFRPFRLFRPSK
ncbi:hypothetical protein [Natronoglomus mannanivorans]|uniref:Uncharacterized protein n=1 Tax=Natronoglomus mannanivorans TaxID=2979990 RepID=A0AAP2YV66_9EURY|nr:hypothetical protein [Halobacteria archaeon AArc-xg1-1]